VEPRSTRLANHGGLGPRDDRRREVLQKTARTHRAMLKQWARKSVEGKESYNPVPLLEWLASAIVMLDRLAKRSANYDLRCAMPTKDQRPLGLACS